MKDKLTALDIVRAQLDKNIMNELVTLLIIHKI